MPTSAVAQREAGECAGPPAVTEPHFGDILGPQSNAHAECERVAGLSPMERVVLTANGNLQRIMSAYYGTECTVRLLAVEPRGESKWWRSVELVAFGKVFCAAQTDAHVTNPDWARQVASGEIGLGQLFSKYRMLPHFQLLDAAKSDGTLERVYKLEAVGLTVVIREQFAPAFLDFSVRDGQPGAAADAAPLDQTFGDIMRGVSARVRVPAELPRWLRVLATANGNVQRLLASALRKPVAVTVLSSDRQSHRCWRRQIEMTAEGRTLLAATNVVTVDDDAVRSAIESGSMREGEIFRSCGMLPQFDLKSAVDTPAGLRRQYTLTAPERGITCQIDELFSPEAARLLD